MYCTFFGLQWFHCDSTQPRLAPACWFFPASLHFHRQCLIQESHQGTVMSSSSSSLLLRTPVLLITLKEKNRPEKQKVQDAKLLTKSVSTCVSAAYYINQIQNLECIYSPSRPPFFLLPPQALITVLGLWSMT